MRARPHGFTLIEMMIGVALGAIVILGAVAFAGHEVRVMTKSNQELEMNQVGRATMDLLAADLANAGAGVGEIMLPAGPAFGGLTLGAFAIPGGLAFNSNNRAITLEDVTPGGAFVAYNTRTDDIGIRIADGTSASVVTYNAGAGVGQVCLPEPTQIPLVVNDDGVLHDQLGFFNKSVRLTAISGAVACTNGAICESNGLGANGCINVTFTDYANQFLSEPGAAAANYAGGWLSGSYKEVVWFVETNNRVGTLRRVAQNNWPCAAYNTCGQVVADNVESLHMQVLRFDPTTNTWVDHTIAGLPTVSPDNEQPLRVDIELVLRARSPEPEMTHDVPALLLDGGNCLTTGAAGPCPKSMVRRLLMRRTVELKNGGRMKLGV
jgi:prepilin-type N-terminal cleavage/methylation domain-containing protein